MFGDQKCNVLADAVCLCCVYSVGNVVNKTGILVDVLPLVSTVENTCDDRKSQGSQPSTGSRPSLNILCHPTKSQKTNLMLLLILLLTSAIFAYCVVICADH